MESNDKAGSAEDRLISPLFRLSSAILLANISQTVYQTVDMVWVGRLDTEAVATVGVCYPVIGLLTGLYTGLFTASFVLVAQYNGARANARVNHVVAQSLILVGIASIVFSGLGVITSSLLLRLIIGSHTEGLSHALRYLQVSLIGCAFVSVVSLYGFMLRGLGAVRAALHITALGVVINIVLDPLLIFGAGPIPGQGVVGAAYATLIAQAATTVVVLFRLYRGRFGIELRACDFAPDWALIKRILRLGIPASLQACIDPVALFVFTGIVASFGTIALAANGVALRIFAFSVILQTSISSATGILVGAAMGAGDTVRARRVAVRSTWILFVISIVLTIPVFAFATSLISIFVPSNELVITEGARAVRIMSLSFGFVGAWLGLASTFTSSGDTLFPMITTLVIYWTVEIPIAWVLSKHTDLGTAGLWISYPASAFAGAAAGLIWFRLGRWKEIDLIGARSGRAGGAAALSGSLESLGGAPPRELMPGSVHPDI